MVIRYLFAQFVIVNGKGKLVLMLLGVHCAHLVHIFWRTNLFTGMWKYTVTRLREIGRCLLFFCVCCKCNCRGKSSYRMEN